MSERIGWLDGWRGLVCWLMVFYHFCFDLVMFGWMPYAATQQWPLFTLQRFIALGFIFLSGVSARFTHSNLRRGLITAAAGVVVVAASYVVGAPIRFGILQFLSCAMILYHFIGRFAEKVPVKLAPWLWSGLYLAARIVSYTTFVEPEWLYWLGLRTQEFVSFDWVPIFPNIFMFLLGAWFGEKLTAAPADSRLRTMGAPKFLTWPGRRTLIIYLVHQPVLYGACWLASIIMS